MDQDHAGDDPMPEPRETEANPVEPAPPQSSNLVASLPKELGVMLVSAGVIGMVLPGPGTPALIAGGLILWPEAFGKAERWFQKRYPKTHRQGMGHINRFLSDLERRYPGSTADAQTRLDAPKSPSSQSLPSDTPEAG